MSQQQLAAASPLRLFSANTASSLSKLSPYTLHREPAFSGGEEDSHQPLTFQLIPTMHPLPSPSPQPFGSPSCCSSLSSESPPTECLAALLRMKERAATAALISESSNFASLVSFVTLAYCVSEGSGGGGRRERRGR